MTFAAASLYRYTPGASGNCATFSRSRVCGDCIFCGFPQGQYNWIMSRCRVCLIWTSLAFATVLPAQQAQTPVVPEGQQIEEGQLPPEEDKAKIPEQYSFNPLRSKKEVTVGE